MAYIANAYHLGLADGPTEVHKSTLARTLLSQATPTDGLFPTAHIPARREAALAKYASQQHRRYADPEYIWNVARTHGVNNCSASQVWRFK